MNDQTKTIYRHVNAEIIIELEGQWWVATKNWLSCEECGGEVVDGQCTRCKERDMIAPRTKLRRASDEERATADQVKSEALERQDKERREFEERQRRWEERLAEVQESHVRVPKLHQGYEHVDGGLNCETAEQGHYDWQRLSEIELEDGSRGYVHVWKTNRQWYYVTKTAAQGIADLAAVEEAAKPLVARLNALRRELGRGRGAPLGEVPRPEGELARIPHDSRGLYFMAVVDDDTIYRADEGMPWSPIRWHRFDDVAETAAEILAIRDEIAEIAPAWVAKADERAKSYVERRRQKKAEREEAAEEIVEAAKAGDMGEMIAQVESMSGLRDVAAEAFKQHWPPHCLYNTRYRIPTAGGHWVTVNVDHAKRLAKKSGLEIWDVEMTQGVTPIHVSKKRVAWSDGRVTRNSGMPSFIKPRSLDESVEKVLDMVSGVPDWLAEILVSADEITGGEIIKSNGRNTLKEYRAVREDGGDYIFYVAIYVDYDAVDVIPYKSWEDAPKF